MDPASATQTTEVHGASRRVEFLQEITSYNGALWILTAGVPIKNLHSENPRVPKYYGNLNTDSGESGIHLPLLTPILTMFGAIGQPLVPRVPSNPLLPSYSISLRTHTNDKVSIKDTFFGGEDEPPKHDPIPNPQIKIRDVTLRTHLEELRQNLLSQDALFGAAGEVPSYDWQNPKLPIPNIALRTFIHKVVLELLSQDLMFGTAGEPLVQSDWPLPRVILAPLEYQGIKILDPSLPIITPLPIPVIVPTSVINEFSLGPAFINKIIDLLRNR
jgi:hypothetical protein